MTINTPRGKLRLAQHLTNVIRVRVKNHLTEIMNLNSDLL